MEKHMEFEILNKVDDEQLIDKIYFQLKTSKLLDDKGSSFKKDTVIKYLEENNEIVDNFLAILSKEDVLSFMVSLLSKDTLKNDIWIGRSRVLMETVLNLIYDMDKKVTIEKVLYFSRYDICDILYKTEEWSHKILKSWMEGLPGYQLMHNLSSEEFKRTYQRKESAETNHEYVRMRLTFELNDFKMRVKTVESLFTEIKLLS